MPKDRRIAFKHSEPESLRQVLQAIKARSSNSIVYVALESLYSMDGDMAPLPDILDVIDQHVPRTHQCVILDEAHSTAVYGEKGRGIGYAVGEEGGWGDRGHERGKGRISVRLMTFGKAVGCSGGVALDNPPESRAYSSCALV